MASKRAETEKYILDSIASLTPKSKKNVELYEARFKSMSDKQFADFIDRLESEEEVLMIVSPNHADDGLSLENNLKIADKIGHNFFPRILITGKQDLPPHYTPVRFMVLDLPVRRLSQTSDKKIQVPKNTKVVDSLTGQVTGESKGASLSGPEVQILAAMGLEAPLIEAMKYRGGDRGGRNAMTAMITKLGQANIKTLSNYATGVESTFSMKTFLSAAMLVNSL